MSRNGHPNEVSDHVECPLCMEPFELDDISFYPCTCGYQICRFCWHRIRTDESGLCPACRKPYSENPAEYTPLTAEQVQKMKGKKKQKVQDKKQKVLESRKNLADVRVVQRNLVFVIGLSPRLADPEVLKRQEYFGRFGKIVKVVINNHTVYTGQQGPSVGAYITYSKREEAVRAIQAVNSAFIDGRYLKASFGTTKYCTFFLRGSQCSKLDCMYLHELGEEEASFTKEDMQQGKHQLYENAQLANIVTQKDPPHPPPSTTSNKKPLLSVPSGGGGVGGKKGPLLPAPVIQLADSAASDPDSALPASAQWAQKTTSSQLPAEGRPISEPTRGRAGKDKLGKASKRGGRKQTASPNMDGVKPHNQKSGQAHSTVSSERGRVSEPVPSSTTRGGDSLDVISEPSSSPISSLHSSPKSMARSVESLDDPTPEPPAPPTHNEGKREREEEKEREEEEAEAFPSAIFQKAGSVQQNAPPILKGKDWLIGEVEEDGEEDSLSALVGLHHQFGSLGVAWTGTDAPVFERSQDKERTATTATAKMMQQTAAPPQVRSTTANEVFQSSIIPSLTLRNPTIGAAEKGNASKVVNRVNKKEEEEKQRRASESYVNFGPTTNECDSKAGQEGRGLPAKQKAAGVQSQLLGGDLNADSQGWRDGFKALLPGVNVNFSGGGLLSTPTGSTTWQGATPLVGFGHMTSRSLVQPTASSASQWPDVFGDSPLQPGGFGKKTSESESKKQTSETSKGASRPPPGFSTSHKEHLPMTDSVWGPAEQRPLGIPAVPWPTAAMQTQFKPTSTLPVATATTGMLIPSAPPPHAYLFPQQPIYGAPLVWGSFGLPTSTTTAAPASLHQQLQSGLIPSVPGVVRASPAPRTLQRGGADNGSALVHKDENTGQISQKASSSLRH